MANNNYDDSKRDYYPDKNSDKSPPQNTQNLDLVTVTKNEPMQSISGHDKLVSYLKDSLNNHDKNGDNILSPEEFRASRSDRSLDPNMGDFVEKHFGTLSILSTDGLISEGGISRNDLLKLHGNVEERAQSSFVSEYGRAAKIAGTSIGLMAGTGAQVADFVFTGGTVTGLSTMGHIVVGGVAAATSNGVEAPLLPLAGALAGMAWGPTWGGMLGSDGGEWLGQTVASNYFQRNHGPKIRAMLSELNQK